MAKKRGGGGGANWMDTYGDMVTLLLCFFVMLYSMSQMDQSKWIALVQALNPSANISGTTTEEPPEGSVVRQEQINADIENLYQAMTEFVERENLASQISVTRGSGYVFISFDDTVFFDGDSYVLRDDGKEVLDQVAQFIGSVSESIDEIRVLGHTAQARADQPNSVEADRFLSSNRAAVVTIYLQEKNIVDPARLVSVGYGQWRPVSGNDTPDERAKNRRVELLVTGLDVENEMGDDITQYYTMRTGEDGEQTTNTAWSSGQEVQETTQTQTDAGQEG